jgi:tetratricopeptide (TPR) repeat protein
MNSRSITGFSLLLAIQLVSLSSLGFAASIPQPNSSSATPSVTAEELGDSAMGRQDYLSAIKNYSQAPASAVVLNKIGVAYHHMQDLDLAMQNYEQALAMQANYPEAMNNLGAIYFSRGNYKQAIRLYKHALKLEPQSAIFADNLGTAYFSHRQYEEGMNAYTTAFKIDPKIFNSDSLTKISSPLTLIGLAHQDFCIAELFAEAGMKNNAIAYLRKALEEGFKDRSLALDDPAFANIRQSADFAQLVAQEKIHN